jgi:hypothetical protein
MPSLIVPGAALVRLVWTLSGTPYAVNVLGTRTTGALTIDQAFANQVGASIKASFTTTLAPQVMPQVSLASVGVRDIRSAGMVEFLDAGAAVPGTSGPGNLLPPQVAFCITLRTARAGKSFRGRVYLPGFGGGHIDGNGATNTVVRDACAAFLNDIRTDLPGAGLSLAIVSRKNLSTELVTLAQGRDLIFDTIRGRATAGI